MTNIATLADRYADLCAEIKGLVRLQDELKAEIKALGREEIVGERAVVKIVLQERSTLSSKLVRELLTEEQIEACTTVSLIESVVPKNIKAPKQIA